MGHEVKPGGAHTVITFPSPLAPGAMLLHRHSLGEARDELEAEISSLTPPT
jgi:hypothetical protein